MTSFNPVAFVLASLLLVNCRSVETKPAKVTEIDRFERINKVTFGAVSSQKIFDALRDGKKIAPKEFNEMTATGPEASTLAGLKSALAQGSTVAMTIYEWNALRCDRIRSIDKTGKIESILSTKCTYQNTADEYQCGHSNAAGFCWISIGSNPLELFKALGTPKFDNSYSITPSKEKQIDVSVFIVGAEELTCKVAVLGTIRTLPEEYRPLDYFSAVSAGIAYYDASSFAPSCSISLGYNRISR